MNIAESVDGGLHRVILSMFKDVSGKVGRVTLLEHRGALQALHTCLVASPHCTHARRRPLAGLQLGEGSWLEIERASPAH